MSDDEMEKFEITDYDLDNEFNMNRPQRRLTKNQAIYGTIENLTINIFVNQHFWVVNYLNYLSIVCTITK